MKKIFTNQNFIKKAFISIIIVLLLSFSVPVKSKAGVGGMLLDPIFDLIGTVFDVVIGALQMFLVDGEMNNSSDGSWTNAFMVSKDSIANYPELVASATDKATESTTFTTEELDDDYYVPDSKYSPDKIFSGQIPALDINFIKPHNWSSADEGTTEYEENAENKRSIAIQLHETIASWYVSLRNLAVVGLMLILLYVGIRIVISSTAADKSKYKQMLADWLVALCLLFTLHYIMNFTVTIIQNISEKITSNISDGGHNDGNNIVVEVNDGTIFRTDLMGLMRFQMQYNTVLKKLLYMLLYIPMVCYTFIFTVKYLKRVINIAILTLVSPLVAFTYPLDKLRDGRAQAFNLWFKEYIFNALEQPLHLIIYTVFGGGYSELVSTNPIIAIIILASIIPAEKLLRKFFGFDQASTSGAVSSFAGAFGGSAAYNMLSKAVRGEGGHSGKGGTDGHGNNNIRNRNQIRDPNAPSGVDGFTDAPLASNNANDSQQQTNDSQEQESTQQRMVDAYDENNFGTDNYDPAEREAMAREAWQPESPQLSRDEFTEEMKNLGYTDEEAEQLAREQYGEPTENSAVQPPPALEQPTSGGPTQTPIHEMAEQKRGNRLIEGIKGSGRAIKVRAQSTLGNGKWWRQVGKNAIRTGGRLVRGAVHTAGRVAMGAAGAAVGAAFGIAGDDISDILKYGAGGFALGASVGGNALNNTVDRIGRGVANSSPVQGFISGYTGLDSSQRAAQRQHTELQADRDFIQGVQREYRPNGQELQGKELDQAVDRAATLYGYGITDFSDIGKALKVDDAALKDLNNNQNLTEEQKAKRAMMQTATARRYAKQIQDPNQLRDPEIVKKLTESYKKSIMLKEPSLTEKDARQNAKQLMKLVKKFHNID